MFNRVERCYRSPYDFQSDRIHPGVGTLQDAEEVLPSPIEVNTETLARSAVKMVTTDSDRSSKVRNFFKHNIQLSGPKKEFCEMPLDHHDVFSLEDNDRGDTYLEQLAFPEGHYWYGGYRNGPGHPPKWIDRFVNGENENGLQSTSEERASDDVSADQNEVDGLMEENNNKQDGNTQYTTQDSDQNNLSAGQTSDIDGLHTNSYNSQIIKEDDEQMEELVPSRTRTRIVRPPVCYQC